MPSLRSRVAASESSTGPSSAELDLEKVFHPQVVALPHFFHRGLDHAYSAIPDKVRYLPPDFCQACRFPLGRLCCSGFATLSNLRFSIAVSFFFIPCSSPLHFRQRKKPRSAAGHGDCTVKYVDGAGNHLVLRPHNHAYPVEVMAMEPGKKVHDYLIGRICYVSIET